MKRTPFPRYLALSLGFHGAAFAALAVAMVLARESVSRPGPLSIASIPFSEEAWPEEDEPPPLEPVETPSEPEARASTLVHAERVLWDLPDLERVWPGDAPPAPARLARSRPREPEVEREPAAERESAVWLEGPDPDYPRLSVRLGEEGVVVCRLAIGADGSVTAVEVVTSSGHARLDAAAVEALSAWRFRAAREGAHAVPSELVHRVVFRLSGR